ncbi:unnamed protein product, partial [Ixodes persulcatus]
AQHAGKPKYQTFLAAVSKKEDRRNRRPLRTKTRVRLVSRPSHGGTGPSPWGTARLHSAPRTSRKTPGGGRTVGASRVSQDDVGLAPKQERRGALPSAPWRATLAQEVHERYSFGRPKVEAEREGGEDHEGGGKRLWKVLVYGAGGPLQPQDIEGGS